MKNPNTIRKDPQEYYAGEATGVEGWQFLNTRLAD